MAARVESQAGGADDGAAPSIPSAFENDHVLGATEAIMWIACRRRFSHKAIQEHLRRHRDHGQWRYGRSQLSRPLLGRAEKAERQLIGLIIGGVPATGTRDDEGHPDHQKRVLVPVEFLKDGAYIELLSGHLRADPLLEKHSGYPRPTYRDVNIDRDAFFKALAKGQEDASAKTPPPHDESDPQAPAETPVPEGSEDKPALPRKKPAKADHERWFARAAGLRKSNKKLKTTQIAAKIHDEEFERARAKAKDDFSIGKTASEETIRRVLTAQKSKWDIPQES